MYQYIHWESETHWSSNNFFSWVIPGLMKTILMQKLAKLEIDYVLYYIKYCNSNPLNKLLKIFWKRKFSVKNGPRCSDVLWISVLLVIQYSYHKINDHMYITSTDNICCWPFERNVMAQYCINTMLINIMHLWWIKLSRTLKVKAHTIKYTFK